MLADNKNEDESETSTNQNSEMTTLLKLLNNKKEDAKKLLKSLMGQFMILLNLLTCLKMQN